MHTHSKVIPPKIVEFRPWVWLVRGLVLLLVLLLVAWTAYDFGTQQTRNGLGYEVEEDPAQAEQVQELKQRLTALEGENTSLRAQLAHWKAESQATQEGISAAEPEQAVERTGPIVEHPVAEPPVAAEDRQLTISDLEVRSKQGERAFRYQFKIGRAGAAEGEVLGSIWIAVNGVLSGKPTRLPLRQVSEKQASFVKMRFKKLQLVEGNITLPKGFSPKNIIVEAKPTVDGYQSKVQVLAWNLVP